MCMFNKLLLNKSKLICLFPQMNLMLIYIISSGSKSTRLVKGLVFLNKCSTVNVSEMEDGMFGRLF